MPAPPSTAQKAANSASMARASMAARASAVSRGGGLLGGASTRTVSGPGKTDREATRSSGGGLLGGLFGGGGSSSRASYPASLSSQAARIAAISRGPGLLSNGMPGVRNFNTANVISSIAGSMADQSGLFGPAYAKTITSLRNREIPLAARTLAGEVGGRQQLDFSTAANTMLNRMALRQAGIGSQSLYGDGTLGGTMPGYDANGIRYEMTGGASGTPANKAFTNATPKTLDFKRGLMGLAEADSTLFRNAVPKAVLDATHYYTGKAPGWSAGENQVKFGAHTFLTPQKNEFSRQQVADARAAMMNGGQVAPATQRPFDVAAARMATPGSAPSLPLSIPVAKPTNTDLAQQYSQYQSPPGTVTTPAVHTITNPRVASAIIGAVSSPDPQAQAIKSQVESLGVKISPSGQITAPATALPQLQNIYNAALEKAGGLMRAMAPSFDSIQKMTAPESVAIGPNRYAGTQSASYSPPQTAQPASLAEVNYANVAPTQDIAKSNLQAGLDYAKRAAAAPVQKLASADKWLQQNTGLAPMKYTSEPYPGAKDKPESNGKNERRMAADAWDSLSQEQRSQIADLTPSQIKDVRSMVLGGMSFADAMAKVKGGSGTGTPTVRPSWSQPSYTQAWAFSPYGPQNG